MGESDSSPANSAKGGSSPVSSSPAHSRSTSPQPSKTKMKKSRTKSIAKDQFDNISSKTMKPNVSYLFFCN